MDYKAFESAIKTFFENNYATYAATKNNNLTYTVIVTRGFPDGDVSGQVNLFLFPGDYQYESLTNDSRLMAMPLKIFLLLKNMEKNSATCLDYIRDYASALHDMLEANNTMSGTIDQCVMTSLEFFDEVEGFSGSVGYEAVITCFAEIQGV